VDPARRRAPTEALELAKSAVDDEPDLWRLGVGRLGQFTRYAEKVFTLTRRLSHVNDRRRKPGTPASTLALAVFYTGLLRIRSFNALEPKLSERPFLHLMDEPQGRQSLGCVDTVSRSLCVMDLDTVRRVSIGIVQHAERNKVFREGWHGALRYVAIDGWEPFSSAERHCDQCLIRHVNRKDSKGEPFVAEEYFHRYVVAMLIGPEFDLALDIEPLRTKETRPPRVPKAGKNRGKSLPREEDEGELTAATRLIRRVKETYGWIDVVVADALYANGPFLTTLKDLALGGVIVVRKDADEPLKAALRVWGELPAQQEFDDEKRKEHIELWDIVGLETLSTYDGPIRVVRGRVTNPNAPKLTTKTWCLLVAGKATRLTARKALEVVRARWHIENTGFHQWTTRWKLNHVFVHDGDGVLALYWLFFAAFNVLTFFLYRQLRSYGRARGKDVTRTISRLVDEMQDDLARLGGSAPRPDSS